MPCVELAEEVPADPGGACSCLPAAGDPRPGRRRRLPDAGRGPRRRRPRRACSRSPTQMVSDDGNAQRGCGAQHHRSARRAAALRRRRPREGQDLRRPARPIVFATLQAYLGSAYVNDFNKFGRTYQVASRPTPSSALTPDDIDRLEVRNRRARWCRSARVATVQAIARPADCINALQPVSRRPRSPASRPPATAPARRSSSWSRSPRKNLPPAMGYDWTGMSYQEKHVGGAGRTGLRPGRAAGLPGARRPVRELVRAVAVILVVPLGLLGADRRRVRCAGWTTTSTRRSASC